MKLFFSGIGGSGVSALAGFASSRGHEVSGSDRLFDADPRNPLCGLLRSAGITIARQDGSGLDSSVDLAIFSTAVEPDNPDYRRALEMAVPLKTRPEYLAGLVSDFLTVAVAGTSGKSTTSGMLAFLMRELGLQPNFIGGGRVKQFRSETNAGNYVTGDSSYLVVEACESDGSIVTYEPLHSIILNLSLDHHDIKETCEMFRRLAANTAGVLILGKDDANLADCAPGKAVTFSVDLPSDYQARDVQLNPLSTTFSVRGCEFQLSLPGRHNLYNALACIALLSEMGIEPGRVAEVLPCFTGIERRFDIHLNDGRHLVVDDYAHNPHKIWSLMQAMKRIGGTTCYIFQPHGYGPTRLMKEGYIEAFSQNLGPQDHLVLLPIYYAGGTAAKDISSLDLARDISDGGRSAEAVDDRSRILTMELIWDNYVVLGARDDSLADLAGMLAERLR